MKQYCVEKCTEGLLMVREEENSERAFSIKPFTTRKDHVFTEMDVVLDPVRLQNENVHFVAESDVQALSARGYSVFAATGPFDKYLLAIPYKNVKIVNVSL